LDENEDGLISFKELEAKLMEYGYTEPQERGIYTHKWQDRTVYKFFTQFNQQRTDPTGFPGWKDLFNFFDVNKDGELSVTELKMAMEKISTLRPEPLERMLHIVLIGLHGKPLTIPDLKAVLKRIERDFSRGFKPKLLIYEDLFLEIFKKLDKIKGFQDYLKSFSATVAKPLPRELHGMHLISM
jgi:Ca2+-binding EF-hand superfamily protein